MPKITTGFHYGQHGAAPITVLPGDALRAFIFVSPFTEENTSSTGIAGGSEIIGISDTFEFTTSPAPAGATLIIAIEETLTVNSLINVGIPSVPPIDEISSFVIGADRTISGGFYTPYSFGPLASNSVFNYRLSLS